MHCLQLSHISIYSCYPLSSAIQHLNILLLSTLFSYPTYQYTAAIHCLQLSHISIYSCYPLSSAIQHLNILLLSTVFSYPTSQYTAAIHYLQLFHISIHSRTSIYCSRINRFPASTIRHFWSRIKFHINNVIYSRFHRSPNYRFPAFIICKSTSRHRISRMDRLKKIEAKYLRYIIFGLPVWQHSKTIT